MSRESKKENWIGCGLVGGKNLKDEGCGTFVDIAIGTGGAVAGGLIMQSAGLGGCDER